MKDFIGLSLIFSLWFVCVYVRYRPIVSKSGHLYVLSYIVRTIEGDELYREFVVYNARKKKFVKSSL